MTRKTWYAMCGVCAVMLVSSTAAHAQSSAQPSEARRWEVEIHAGGMRTGHPTSGTATLPAPGAPFVTIVGAPSRRISSWVFGDGAALLNQAAANWRPNLTRVVALDPILNSASVRRETGANFGLRVSRELHRRLAAEFSIDYAAHRLAIDDAAVASIEATRASVVTTLRDLIVFGANRQLSSTSSFVEQQGKTVVAAGTLNVSFPIRGRAIPYLAVGGGVIAHTGGTPAATLRTEFSIPGNIIGGGAGVTLVEGDTVNIRYTLDRRVPAAIVGGGLKYALTSRFTLRVDARGQFAKNTLRVLVDANPQSNAGPPVPGSFVTAIASNPSIQFSSVTGQVINGQPVFSTLSGPAIRDFVAFSGSGMQKQLGVTTGLAWRF